MSPHMGVVQGPRALPVGLHKKRLIPSHRDLRERMPLMRKGSEKVVREDRDL